MRKLFLIISTIGILLVINIMIYEKESIIRDGKRVFLEIEPIDPRSLIQGDYIHLQFTLLKEISGISLPDKGYIVLSIDSRGIGRFKRIFQGGPLESNEVILAYKMTKTGPKLPVQTFFFEESKANIFTRARYAELRINPKNGRAILMGLRDKNLNLLR